MQRRAIYSPSRAEIRIKSNRGKEGNEGRKAGRGPSQPTLDARPDVHVPNRGCSIDDPATITNVIITYQFFSLLFLA